MPLDSASIQYLKALINGEQVISWHVWWQENAEHLENKLSRTEFLKLKFARVNGAAELLHKQNVKVEWTPKGRREAEWAKLHSDCVDHRGHPLQKFRQQIYEGAVAAYSKDNFIDGDRLLEKVLTNIARISDVNERADSLSELQFDAESLYNEGQVAAGLAMMRAVAKWETDSDLELAVITIALQKLDLIKRTTITH